MENRQKLSIIRSRSCYPSFRTFIKLCAVIGYLAAALVFLFGLMAGSTGKGIAGVGAGALFVGGALLLVLIVTAATEASLMLADLADCAVLGAPSLHQDTHQLSVPAPVRPATTTPPGNEPTLAELTRKSSDETTERGTQ